MRADRKIFFSPGLGALLFILSIIGLCCGRKAPPPVVAPSLNAPSKAAPVLSDEEAVKRISLDRDVLAMIRKESREPFSPLNGWSPDGEQVEAPGVILPIEGQDVEQLVEKMREPLQKKGYQPYITDVAGEKVKCLTLVKDTDPYAILGIMQTNGVNCDITNEKITEKLMAWQVRFPMVILGAGQDWVEVKFRKLPSSMDAFAKEVYEFCPDCVDQGCGSVEALACEIKKTGKLFLWWD
ncbi:MAG: DUF4253 domain-containing protein [Candidatus Eremiobacteraeota bacterium]|nr:DUF4253 domain-containing protein [Candidatus Eremiobacteraeota bacterium]